MRVAIFTEVFLPKIDGITNRLANTVKELINSGHEVMVFAPKGSVSSFHGAEVVSLRGVPFKPYPGVKISFPSRRVLHKLLRFRPDVIHAVGPACLGLYGIVASRFLKIPLIASYHTDFPKYLNFYNLKWTKPQIWRIIRRIHNSATINLCPSRFTKDELQTHGIKNVKLWKGGVDLTLFHPSKRCSHMRERLSDGNPQQPLALYAGRLGHEKNIRQLMHVVKSFTNLRLAIVGDGPARADLQKEFRDYNVTFTGFMKGEKLASAFASADFFIMPSKTETLGFVTLEAMSSGLPVVAAKAGGTTDLVDHNKTGFLYEAHNSLELLNYVSKVMSNKSLRESMSKAARSRAEIYSWQRETKKLISWYHQTIQRSYLLDNDYTSSQPEPCTSLYWSPASI